MGKGLNIIGGILVCLAFAVIGISAVGGFHVGTLDVNIPDGALGGLVLMFLAGLSFTARDRYGS